MIFESDIQVVAKCLILSFAWLLHIGLGKDYFMQYWNFPSLLVHDWKKRLWHDVLELK